MVVASKMNPTAERKPKKQTKGPLSRSLSEANELTKIKMKVRRYGGDDKPFAWTVENVPISAMIVGTNKGSDENDTLQPKYMVPVR